MLLPIADVLSAEQLAELLQLLDSSALVDGKTSAGWAAASVKHNEQYDPRHSNIAKAQSIIQRALTAHPVLQMAARPKALSTPLFNRYREGQHYGWHTDDSIIDGVRADLSYTVFLSAADSYEGGELCIRDFAGEQTFKLPAASALLYRASTIHQVTPVTSGVRVAAVGWIESRIADAEMREWLFSMDGVRRQLYATQPAQALALAQVLGAMLRRFG